MIFKIFINFFCLDYYVILLRKLRYGNSLLVEIEIFSETRKYFITCEDLVDQMLILSVYPFQIT